MMSNTSVSPAAAARGCGLALLVIVGAGCEVGAPPGAAGWSGTVDTTEGVVVVENPERPVFSTEETRAMERWVRSLDGQLDERESWEPAPTVQAGDSGRVFVLDRTGGRVLVFDADSGVVRTEIDPPEGRPGHLESPVGMGVLPRALMVGERYGIELYDLDGSFRDRIGMAIRDSQFDRGVRLHPLDSTGVLMLESRGGAPEWRRYAPSGSTSIYTAPEAVSRFYPEATRKSCWRVSEGPTGPLLASCFYPVVLQLDSVGAVDREIVLPGGPDSATAAQLDRLRQESRAHWRSSEEELDSATIAARVERDVRLHQLVDRYRDVRHDPVTGLTSLLEETPVYLGGGSARLHLFGPDGAYLARIEFPEYWIHHDVRDGIVWAIVRGGDGELSLRSYRLELPEDAPSPRVGGATEGESDGRSGRAGSASKSRE